jgi:hypothetical protein
MGILYVLVMKPFEDLLRSGSILELNSDLEKLQQTFSEWSQDGSIPLQLTSTVFGDKPLESVLAK